LSGWEFIRVANKFTEWNHGVVVASFEQPSDNYLHLHAIFRVMYVHGKYDH